MKKTEILIVEDEKVQSEAISLKLEEYGYTPLVGESVAEARTLLENHPGIQLIILDHYLPNADGLTLLAFLKQDERYKNIPIFLITNSVDDETKYHYMEMGTNKYFAKANTPLEQIIKEMRKTLNHNN